MQKEFPELILCRGHYNGYPHWWLKDIHGNIYDPTKAQFEHLEFDHDDYEEYNGPDPLGKCPNCGEWIWEYHGGACSEECYNEYANYLNSELINSRR